MKLAHGTQPRPVPIRHQGQDAQGKRDKTEDTRRPRRAQLFVHVGRKDGEARAEQATQHRVSGQSARAVPIVAVGEITVDAEEEHHQGKTEGDTGQDRREPWCWRQCRPSEPEDADWQQPRDEDEMRQPGFWHRAEFPYVVAMNPVDLRGEDRCDCHADTDTGEGEAGDTDGPMSGRLEDDGIGGEVEEQHAVDECHVEREREENRFREEHDPGPQQASEEEC